MPASVVSRSLDDTASTVDSSSVTGSSSLAGAAAAVGMTGLLGARRRSMDADSESSATSLDTTAFTGRFKAMASMFGLASFSAAAAAGAAGTVGGAASLTAMTAGTANQSTAERIESLRAVASGTVAQAEESRLECQEAWAAHARAKSAFNSQITAAVSIFEQIERRRVVEISDALRLYTVYQSSMLANLQYDVQRLAAKAEAASAAPAISMCAIEAFTVHTTAARQQSLAAGGHPAVASPYHTANSEAAGVIAAPDRVVVNATQHNAAQAPSMSLGASGTASAAAVRTPTHSLRGPAAGAASGTSTSHEGSPLTLAHAYEVLDGASQNAGQTPDGQVGITGLEHGPDASASDRSRRRSSLTAPSSGFDKGHAASASDPASSAETPTASSLSAVATADGGQASTGTMGRWLGRFGRGYTGAISPVGRSGSAAKPPVAPPAAATPTPTTAAATAAADAPGEPATSGSNVGTTPSAVNGAGTPVAATGAAGQGNSSGAIRSLLGRFGSVASNAAPAAKSSATPPPHPSTSKGSGGKGGMSVSVSLTGSVRNVGANGGLQRAGSREAVTAGATCIEHFVDALFDPSGTLVLPDATNDNAMPPLASRGDGSSAAAAVSPADLAAPTPSDGAVRSLSSEADAEGVPSLSLDAFAAGAAIPSPSPRSARSRTGTGGSTSAPGAGGVPSGTRARGAAADDAPVGGGAAVATRARAVSAHSSRLGSPVDPASLLSSPAPSSAESASSGASVQEPQEVQPPASAHVVAVSESGTAVMVGSPLPDCEEPPASTTSADTGRTSAAAITSPTPTGGSQAAAGSPGTPGFSPSLLHQAACTTRRLSVNGAVSAALHPAVPVLLPRVRKMLRVSADGLSRLVTALDARRGEGIILTRPSFDALSSALLTALDVADQRNDFSRARALMVISQTFYCYVRADDDADAVDATVAAAAVEVADATSPRRATAAATTAATPDRRGAAAAILSSPDTGSKSGTTRLYLQSRIKQHRIWQNIQYWEGAVFDTIGAEMTKIKGDSRYVVCLEASEYHAGRESHCSSYLPQAAPFRRCHRHVPLQTRATRPRSRRHLWSTWVLCIQHGLFRAAGRGCSRTAGEVRSVCAPGRHAVGALDGQPRSVLHGAPPTGCS